jgi:cytochrome P450
MYPPFWMIDRIELNDDEACGVKIPAGVTVVPYIYGAHHNADVWEDPHVFDPTRFDTTLEKNRSRHALAHIPFGSGPRVCIGQNMAVMQMLLIVANMVRNFDFTLTGDQPIDIRPMMILRPAGKMIMKFEPAP